ncbi:E3 ubiquitin-protein ligase HACE1-like, partial [Saccostrea cucullata]|uniref:E3 ubiquitin-protein ligase HACE1-like n=1 Tax=Saccostrea cuccullata TaxID=36930 RepID=UPI002ED0C956
MQYADSGFLRRRVRMKTIQTEEEDRDPFTVYLPEEYIGDLVDRFIIDMQTERLVDVLLNPCLRKEIVIKTFKEKVDSLEKLLVRIKWKIDRSEFPKAFEGAAELVKFAANVNNFTPHGSWTPLILAASNDDEHLRETGLGTNEGERRNKTILCLLNNGADINLCNKNGSSPLHGACEFGNDSSVQLLLNNGSDINLSNKNGFSPLYKACQNGHA